VVGHQVNRNHLRLQLDLYLVVLPAECVARFALHATVDKLPETAVKGLPQLNDRGVLGLMGVHCLSEEGGEKGRGIELALSACLCDLAVGVHITDIKCR
jgi:hypothetical protein